MGFVVYTGNETKLMMNARASRFKMSMVEKQMNKLIFYILIAQILLALIVSWVDIWWYSKNSLDTDSYLYNTYSNGTNWLLTFFRYFLLLNTLIPISLIVTIEGVKVL
jgi:phospholipid-translocating ATPase